VLKLPSMRKVTNGQYAARRLLLPVKEVCMLRSALLRAAVEEFQPSVVLVDKHPLGIHHEFQAALNTVRKAGGRTVLGLRDILDDPTVTMAEWAAERWEEQILVSYDLVIVYGDQAVFDPITKYAIPNEIASRCRFCGYVVNQEKDDQFLEMDWAALNWAALGTSLRTRRLVVATTGGGEDGFALLETFIRAAAEARWQGIAIAGPMVPDREWKGLSRLATEMKVTVYPFVPGLSSLLWFVDALVCMGGYNTLLEAVSRGVPTVCVPRIQPRIEQLIRSEAFARLGLVHTLHPEQLNVDTLNQAVDNVLTWSRQEQFERAHTRLHFDGAQRAASHLLALAVRQHQPAMASIWRQPGVGIPVNS
jgi:predicted glycosyltransferase